MSSPKGMVLDIAPLTGAQ